MGYPRAKDEKGITVTDDTPAGTSQPEPPVYQQVSDRVIGNGRSLRVTARQVGGQDRGFCDLTVKLIEEQTASLWSFGMPPEAFDRVHAPREHPIREGGYFITVETIVDEAHAAEAQTSQSPLRASVEGTIQMALAVHHQRVMQPELTRRLEEMVPVLEAHLPRPVEIDDDTRRRITDLVAGLGQERPDQPGRPGS